MTESTTPSYEQALARLDEVLRSLEEGGLTLEETIAAVARGREYLQLCQDKLEEARRKIESLPVSQEPLPEQESPHPASVAELREQAGGGSRPPQGEIPF
jgi:exodeoxyribonuclease VII small subunit